jgi:hypothetical protein
MHIGVIGKNGGKVNVYMTNPSACPWPHDATLRLVYGDGAGFKSLPLAGITNKEMAKVVMDFPAGEYKKDWSFWALCSGGRVFGSQLICIQHE